MMKQVDGTDSKCTSPKTAWSSGKTNKIILSKEQIKCGVPTYQLFGTKFYRFWPRWMGHLYSTQKRNIHKLYVFDKQKIRAILNQAVADKRMESLAVFNHIVRPSLEQGLTPKMCLNVGWEATKNICKQTYHISKLLSSWESAMQLYLPERNVSLQPITLNSLFFCPFPLHHLPWQTIQS